MSKCDFDPVPYGESGIGMFHCPKCGEMVLAGFPHHKQDTTRKGSLRHKMFKAYMITTAILLIILFIYVIRSIIALP